jgi:hypothetical protein
MAFMLMQRITTAVLDGYEASEDVAGHVEAARSHRAWLESLAIDDGVRLGLVEQARALEEAFERLQRRG